MSEAEIEVESAPSAPAAPSTPSPALPDFRHPADFAGDILYLGTLDTPARQEWWQTVRERFALYPKVAMSETADLLPPADPLRYKLTKLSVIAPDASLAEALDQLQFAAARGALVACPEITGLADAGWESGIHYLPLANDPERHAAKLVEYVMAYVPNHPGYLDGVRREGMEKAKEKEKAKKSAVQDGEEVTADKPRPADDQPGKGDDNDDGTTARTDSAGINDDHRSGDVDAGDQQSDDGTDGTAAATIPG